MAIGVNGGGIGNGFGNRRRAGGGALSEINVTPFVDVVLVLLIIFMLTAHVMEFGIDVDVPHVRNTQESSKDLPVISINKEGMTYLNDKEVNINELKPAILNRYPGAKGVYVRAHRDTIYEPIAQIISELNALGFQVLLVTQPEEETAKRK